MDREILFRGRTIKTRFGGGKWIEGFFVMSCAGHAEMEPAIITGTEKGCFMTEFVDPATVGQFTGLYDKNGKKIFEGDILTTDLFRPYVVVIFRDGCFMFNCNDGGKDYWDIMLPIMKEAQTQTLYHEVIGNIHDTPDLGLKEEAE